METPSDLIHYIGTASLNLCISVTPMTRKRGQPSKAPSAPTLRPFARLICSSALVPPRLRPSCKRPYSARNPALATKPRKGKTDGKHTQEVMSTVIAGIVGGKKRQLRAPCINRWLGAPPALKIAHAVSSTTTNTCTRASSADRKPCP